MTAQKLSPDLQSSYLQYLPAIFQREADQAADGEQPQRLRIGRLLLAFEKILTGLGDPDQPGLEEVINRLHTYFVPGPAEVGKLAPTIDQRAPEKFLPWLASWVAFSLREDWNEEERRRYLAEIVSLYRWRGTKASLVRLLEIYTRLVEGGCILQVSDFAGQEDTTFLVGRSQLGQNSQIGGSSPHHFGVTIYMPENYKPPDVWQQRDIVANLIKLEKPAHTTCTLDIRYVTMRIDEDLQIGKNTFLSNLTQYVTMRIDDSLRVGVNTFLGPLPTMS